MLGSLLASLCYRMVLTPTMEEPLDDIGKAVASSDVLQLTGRCPGHVPRGYTCLPNVGCRLKHLSSCETANQI